MRIQLNALDKDSSGNYSKTINVNSIKEFDKEIDKFMGEIPFSRYYFDNVAEEPELNNDLAQYAEDY